MESRREQMEIIFTVIHYYLGQQEYDAINTLLDDLDIELLDTIVTIGILRASFAARGKLPAWEGLRDRLRDTLLPEQMRLMRGLL